METLVQIAQAISGALWLLPAVYLTPRILAAWSRHATRAQILSAPIAFLSWLMVGYSARWLVWPRAIEGMELPELVTWAALYTLSGALALWFFAGARQTRHD